MPSVSNPIGPAGRAVARTFSRIRNEWGMSKAELSRRLTGIGRPMSLDVITKVEAGERPLDVDDLVALATVFDLRVAALLAEAVGIKERPTPTACGHRRNTRRQLSDAKLPEVAEVYLGNPHAGTLAVERAFGLNSRRTASLYVKRARDAGLLEVSSRTAANC